MTPLAFSRLLAASTLAIGLLAPLTASAKTCAADAECNPNQKCEVVASSGSVGCPPCAEGADCPPCVQPSPSTIKECVDQPIACTTDADCPSYLACTAENTPSPTCPACEDDAGNKCPPCEPAPPPSGKKFCSYVERKCTKDADCGAGFVCETSEVGTCAGAAPDCPPNADCPAPPEPTCTTEKISRCSLKITECKANSDCPTDFSCETVSEGSCGSSGGGSSSGGSGTRPSDGTDVPPSSGGGGDTPVPSPPNPGPAPQHGDDDHGADCVTTSRQLCIPKGVGFGSASDSGGVAGGVPRADGESSGNGKGTSLGGNPQGPTTEGAPANASSEDGCTTAAPGKNGGAAWSLLLLAAGLVGLGKRRRSA